MVFYVLHYVKLDAWSRIQAGYEKKKRGNIRDQRSHLHACIAAIHALFYNSTIAYPASFNTQKYYRFSDLTLFKLLYTGCQCAMQCTKIPDAGDTMFQFEWRFSMTKHGNRRYYATESDFFQLRKNANWAITKSMLAIFN